MTHLVFPSSGGSGFITNTADTNSIDLDVTGGILSADLRLSTDGADPGFLIVQNDIRPGPNFGLRTQVSTSSILPLLSAIPPILYNNVTGVISSQPASVTDPGHVTITAQSFAGNKTFQDRLYAGGEFGHSIVTLTDNGVQNDYSTLNRYGLNMAGGSVTFTGFADGFNGKRILVIGNGTVTLKNLDTGSAVGNRILTMTGGDVVLPPGRGIELVYYSVFNVWTPVTRPVINATPDGNTPGFVYSYHPDISNSSFVVAASTTFNCLPDDGITFLECTPDTGDCTINLPDPNLCQNKVIVIKSTTGSPDTFATIINPFTGFFFDSFTSVLNLYENEAVCIRCSGGSGYFIESISRISRSNRYGFVNTHIYVDLNSIYILSPDATISLQTNDNIKVISSDCAGGLVGNVVNLPLASQNIGRVIYVHQLYESASPTLVYTTVQTTGGDSINQSSTNYLLQYKDEYVVLVCTDPSRWSVLGNFAPSFTIGSMSTFSNVNGMSLAGGLLRLHRATATTPGAVSATAQTFGGDKTFQNRIIKGMHPSNGSFFEDVLGDVFGVLVNDLESCTVTLQGEAFVLDIEIEDTGYIRASSCYNSDVFSYVDDPMNLGLISDSGVGVYISKSSYDLSLIHI